MSLARGQLQSAATLAASTARVRVRGARALARHVVRPLFETLLIKEHAPRHAVAAAGHTALRSAATTATTATTAATATAAAAPCRRRRRGGRGGRGR